VAAWQVIMDTLYHELAHNEISEHDGMFVK
jgi:hypothetical protein